MAIFRLFLYSPLWNAAVVCVIIGTGIWLTICTDFVQIRLLPGAMQYFFHSKSKSVGTSPFRALCTALAGTLGTGNLAGVAGAICLGGPGVVFWMFICAILSMAVKFAEATLSVQYRYKYNGEPIGGPMYMIQYGLGPKFLPLAKLYSIFGVFACFGIGTTVQANTIIDSIHVIIADNSPPKWLLGLLLSGLVGLSLAGGSRSIGRISEYLIPYEAGAYILVCIYIVFSRIHVLPNVLRAIIEGAFSPRAVTGGVVGSCFTVLKTGCSRSIFSNEAGMGTASIAHASADVEHSVRQGMLGMVEVLLDTVIICPLTALAILCSGVMISFGKDIGVKLTSAAFAAVLGEHGQKIVAVFGVLFAYATILSWGLYGFRCIQFLSKHVTAEFFFMLQAITVILGAFLSTPFVWRLAEQLNMLMAIPNLTALVLLSPKLRHLIKSFSDYSGTTAETMDLSGNTKWSRFILRKLNIKNRQIDSACSI